MSDTHSPSDPEAPPAHRWARGVDIAFALWTAGLLLATLLMDGYETVPYHIVFVSFAAVYGFRAWSVPVTVFVLGSIVVATGLIFYAHWARDTLPGDEMFEIVLMPAILAAMVWHARRRFAAQREVEHLMRLERERRLHEHELARDTAHAVRTPLTIARGHVELIRETARDDLSRHDADVALAELDRIGRMVGRLLAISELERPDAVTPKLVDLVRLCTEVHDRWSAAVPRRWSIEVPVALQTLVDGEVMRTAMDALVENAAAVTGPEDDVRVICRRVQDSVLLAVADSGPGIAPADAVMVFQRFWRKADRRDGTGLGLSYVRAAAEAHGGDVVVIRSALGGVLVGFRLPLVGGSLPTAHTAAPQTAVASA